MSYLQGKRILLAVTGSIAAYKTPQLVRLLVKQGAEVKVLMTASAATLVAPLSLSTVSKNPVLQSVASGDNWNHHVALGHWADVLLIAPLSANSLAHLAQGLCSNIIHAVYLSAKCPVVFAPAMDEDMWHHEAVQNNFHILSERRQHHYIPVESGELASGLVGEGRMAEPEHIIQYLEHFFEKNNSAAASLSIQRKKAIVTAGPTYELLDPVRFIGNFSSGKMGIALADALVKAGFEVDLIVGPGVKAAASQYIKVHAIVSALELKDKVDELFEESDMTIMAAAVADFRPAEMQKEKIKKGTDTSLSVELVKNPDILQHLGSKKRENQVLVGFALETENELQYAQEKLKRKKADYIALNSLREEGAGFGKDTNKITLISRDGHIEAFPLASKAAIAEKMVNFIIAKEKMHV